MILNVSGFVSSFLYIGLKGTSSFLHLRFFPIGDAALSIRRRDGSGPVLRNRQEDLLCKDYQTDHKFTVTTYTSNGIAITSSATKNNDLIFGEIQSQIKNKNITFDVKTNSNVTTTVTIDELATPGLKTILSFVGPDQKSGKVNAWSFARPCLDATKPPSMA